jgi:hypothetical protein
MTRQTLGRTIPRRLMMTTRSFASLAFKLLGTYMLVESVVALQMNSMNLNSIPRNQSGFPSIITYITTWLLPSVLVCVFGAVLIAMSNLLAQYAVSTEGQVEEAVLTVKATQSLAFSLLGLFFSVSAVIKLVFAVNTFMTTRPVKPSVFGPVKTFPSFWWPQLADGLVELAMGAYLFFCASSLSKFWHRIQESRMPPLSGEQKS